MRTRSLAVLIVLAALPALAQQNPQSGNRSSAPRTGPSPTSGSDMGPFPPGNAILNPVDAPRFSQPEPAVTATLPAPTLSRDEALLAEIAARHRLEQAERSMDRVEREHDRAAARAAVTPPPIAGAFTGSTDPRDR